MKMKKLYAYMQSAIESKDKKKLMAVMDALSIENVLKEKEKAARGKWDRSFFIDAAPGLHDSRSEKRGFGGGGQSPLPARGLLSSDSLDSFQENLEGEVETEAQSRAAEEMTELLETFVNRFAENVPDPIVSEQFQTLVD